MISSETRELAFKKAYGFCMHHQCCFLPANQLHHMLPNTRNNREKFPLFIDSIFNLCPVNNNCHMTRPLPKITERQAIIYEEWLRRFRHGK